MTHTRPTTSNFEQVVNLPYSQANSASYPQWDEKQVAASTMKWDPRMAHWDDGTSTIYTENPIVW